MPNRTKMEAPHSLVLSGSPHSGTTTSRERFQKTHLLAMRITVPVTRPMIVLGTGSPHRNVTCTDSVSGPNTSAGGLTRAGTDNFKPRATSHRPALAHNRRLTLAIAVPLCCLFLLAVLGCVLYWTRRRQPLRHGTGGRRKSGPEVHRNNFIEPSNTPPPAEPSSEEQPVWQRPSTAIKRSDDGLSRITELPSVSDDTPGHRTSRELHEQPLSPTAPPPELPSSLSSQSETINSPDSSSDDFAGHLSGLDEDPFSDRAATAAPMPRQETSPEISPSSLPPAQHRPQIETASSVGAATSESSAEHPVTAINTQGPNSVNEEQQDDEPSDGRAVVSRAASPSSELEHSSIEIDDGTPSQSDDPRHLQPAGHSDEPAHHHSSTLNSSTAPPRDNDTSWNPFSSSTIPATSARSSIVEETELPPQHATHLEEQRDNSDDDLLDRVQQQQQQPSNNRAEDTASSREEEHFLDAFILPTRSSRSSSSSHEEYPAPPLSDRGSWLHREEGEEEEEEQEQDTGATTTE